MRDLCIGCGDMELAAEHPLFDGGLCLQCKVGGGKPRSGWVDECKGGGIYIGGMCADYIFHSCYEMT